MVKGDDGEYIVNTVTFNQVLSEHNAPVGFDFISIDVEGAEPNVLRGFDISYWQPKIVMIEHNYQAFRSDVQSLMQKNGYQQAYERSSRFDDWYFRNEIVS